MAVISWNGASNLDLKILGQTFDFRSDVLQVSDPSIQANQFDLVENGTDLVLVKARDATGGNTESRAYYAKLWDLSGDIFVEQASLSAQNLASMWYTAWRDAGRPSIPRAPQQISEATIWRRKPAQEVPSAWPFFVAFIVAAIVIVWLSARKKKPE